jgi:glycosyltransferase involved in cell wall biosynthesis
MSKQKFGLNGWFLTKPYTGIGQYTANLLRAMIAEAPDAEWVVALPERLKTAPQGNITFKVLPQKSWLPTASLRKWVWEQFQVPALFKREKVDVAHYPYPANPRFQNRLRPKTTVTVHDVIPWTDPAYRRRLRTRLYQAWAQKALLKADQIICVSQTTADALTDRLPQLPLQNIHVIPEAAAPEFSLKGRKRPTKKPYFLYVGGYDTRKNVQRLIEAFQEYIAPQYAIDLVLVGAKDTLKNLQESATPRIIQSLQQGPHRGRVQCTPPMSPSTLAETYRSALALVHPSLSEGFNLPLLEAAACGTPLLVSDIPVHREILGEQALFCDPTRCKALGQMLLDFLNDPPLQQRLREATTALRAQYTWKRAAQETLKIYIKAGP